MFLIQTRSCYMYIFAALVLTVAPLDILFLEYFLLCSQRSKYKHRNQMYSVILSTDYVITCILLFSSFVLVHRVTNNPYFYVTYLCKYYKYIQAPEQYTMSCFNICIAFEFSHPRRDSVPLLQNMKIEIRVYVHPSFYVQKNMKT